MKLASVLKSNRLVHTIVFLYQNRREYPEELRYFQLPDCRREDSFWYQQQEQEQQEQHAVGIESETGNRR